MLPSGFAVLYYLFDVQLFLQPQCVRKRGQHGSGVNWCVVSLDAMAAGMWHILHPAHMRAIILCDNCVLSLPVNLFTVLTYPTHPTAYPRNGLAARYGEKLSDKVRTILKSYISLCDVLYRNTWCVQVLRPPKEAFAAAMQSWHERCEKCVCLQGDYIEKWLHFQLPVVSSFF